MPQFRDGLEAKSKRVPVDIEQVRRRGALSVLQERTNSATAGLNVANTEQRLVTAPYTPIASFKLGIPVIATPRSSSVSSLTRDSEKKEQCTTTRGDAQDIRRLKRYSAAEGKLATTFRNCTTELSPQELQIRALKKATSILNSHAHDARDRAQELQVILADRKMDPVVFETLKRERWMEEKRQLAVEQERKAVLEHLQTLTKSLHDDASHTQARAPTAQVRRDTNLIKFLESSQTHKPMHPHMATFDYVERSSRRRTMDKVSPMRLRTTSTKHGLAESAKHLRSISLDGHNPEKLLPRPTSFSPDKSTSKPNLPASCNPLGVVTEYVASDSPSNSTTPALSDHSTTFDETLSTPLTIATSALPHPTLSTDVNCERETDPNNQGGTATIFRSAPRVASDNLIDNLHVSLPDYAVDLFARFEVDMAPLQPMSYLSDPPSTTRVPGDIPAHQTHTRVLESSFLHIPSSPKQKDTPVKRSSSYRNIRSLISIPEALSSRLGVEKTSVGPSSGFFAKQGGEGHEITPGSSTVSLVVPDVRGGIANRVKKRFSALRIHS